MSSPKHKYPSNKNNIEKSIGNEFYSIYKILGISSNNNFSITKNEINGLIAWICGSYVIFYDITTDSQVLIIKNINNKILSCIRLSNNGKYLITGEGKCNNGEICLYEIIKNGEKYNYKLMLSYVNHMHGIEKLFFFKEDKYILSIGDKEDGLINIMDLDNKTIIYTYKFNIDILGVDLFNDFAVICGYNFIKIYHFNFDELSKNKNPNNFLIKKSVDLIKLKEKNFINALIYDNTIAKQQKIFLLTEDGYLVEMLLNQLTLNRWINLKINKCYNLAIFENKIGIGCSDGIYRIFNIDNLTYIQTLPNPSSFCFNNLNLNEKLISTDIICNLYSAFHNKLILVYSNNLFIIWNVQDIIKIEIDREHLFLNSKINNIDLAIDEKEGLIKIVSSNDDCTVIYWNFKIDEILSNFNNKNYQNKISNTKNINNAKSIKHIFYCSKKFEQMKIQTGSKSIQNNSCNSQKQEEDIKITALKFSDDQKYLFIANSIGNLNIYSLENNFNKIKEISIHKNRINKIDTISINNSNNEIKKLLLATGSSDMRINIYEINKNIYIFKNSKDFNTISQKMSSEVINIKFFQDINKAIKLIVVELNSTITFFQLNQGVLNILQKYQEPNLKTYFLSYIPSIQKIISGNNGKILIWKTNSSNIYKNFVVSKGEHELDNFLIEGDREGIIFATFNDDNIIRIRALYNGKLLCKIEIAEKISCLSFILNDNFLMAISVEGNIYFYKINKNFISKLKNENELINSIEEKNAINNKFKFLQKLIENDVSTSKNDKIKKLIEKFNTNEPTNFNDLNQLDEFVFENKNRLSIKNEDIIQIKEENNIINTKELNKNNFENPHDNMFKKNQTKSKKVKNKVFIQDSNINNNKNDIIKRNTNLDINNLNKIKSARKVKSPNNIKINNISPKKFNFTKKINQTETKIYSYNPNEIIKLSIKNKLKYNKLDTPKQINNNKYKKIIKKYDLKKIIIFKNIRFSIIKQNIKKYKYYIVSKQISFYIINNKSNNKKDILINQIKDINLKNINKKNDLIILENKLQTLKEKIRLKLNYEMINPEKEKLLDTFGVLLVDKISNLNK